MKDPVVPRFAATVVLARDRPAGGVEVFLVQRHGNIGFMGGVHVFPGGALSVDDVGEPMRARIVNTADEFVVRPWGAMFERDRAIGLAVAGIRETFEESGVLLCDTPHTDALPSLRARLLGGEPFAALLEEAALSLRLDVLRPLARWITPKLEPKRYDTLFFVARAPENQHAEHDRQETIAGLWLSPDAALAKARDGEIRMAPPTVRTLETFRDDGSVDAALARAARSTPPLIEPVIRIEGDEVLIFMPGDPEHPVREQAFPGPTRQVLRRVDRPKSG